MSFKKGKINVTAFRLGELASIQGVPEIIELANAKAARALKDVKEIGVASVGWVSGSVILNEEITEDNSRFGDWLFINYRKAEKKINSDMLKAICEQKEALYLENNEAEYVSARVKKEIQEEAVLVLSEQPIMSVKAIPVIAMNETLFIGSTNENELDSIISLFYKTFNVEPIQINPSFFAYLSKVEGNDYVSLGREFLTWLYWQKDEKICDVQFTVGAPLDFITDDTERGCTNAIMKGDLAPISRESSIALQENKLLRKAVLTIVDGDDIYTGTFDADKFSFSSLELPDVEKGSIADVFSDRMELLVSFFNKLEDLFLAFIARRSAPEYQIEFQKWINNN